MNRAEVLATRSAATQIAARSGGLARRPRARDAATSNERRAHLRVHFLVEQEPGRQQRVVQFVGIARIGPHLVADALDRRCVERADVGAGRRPRVASARPASAAPRAAHRRGTRTAAR